MDNILTEKHLEKSLMLTELGIELKDKCYRSEKYLTDLKNLFHEANRTLATLQSTSKSALIQARKILKANYISSELRHDYDKLISIIDTELDDFEQINYSETDNNATTLSEKINALDNRREKMYPTNALRCRTETDEKYPESWTRDSSIDLSNVVNLPPVPEDVFTTFNTRQPMRTSSLSSLKGIRKVKLFLQKADNSEDEDLSSDNDTDPDSCHKGDSNETLGFVVSPRKLLGNIKEETHDTNVC